MCNAFSFYLLLIYLTVLIGLEYYFSSNQNAQYFSLHYFHLFFLCFIKFKNIYFFIISKYYSTLY